LKGFSILKFWAEKKIVLVVSGGISAYKSLDLIRALRKEGAEITVVATASALEFVTRLSLQSLSGAPVHCDLWKPDLDDGMDHIHLTRGADLLLIAPATANLMAKMASGLADDLASTLILAHDGPVLAAPAMNSRMWSHPATRRNVTQLKSDGVYFINPTTGSLACGEEGEGRLAPIEQIMERAQALLTPKILANHRLLITAGPTHEALDPVRFIANRSSGKMGWSICRAALRAGATVDLIHGPVSLALPEGVRAHPVTSAQEMFHTALALWEGCDGAILTAAVGDYRPTVYQTDKIKKQSNKEEQTLTLTTNPDILATLAKSGAGKVVVGFAAETGKALVRGREKMARKGCDLLVINDLLEKGAGFEVDTNRVTLLNRQGEEEIWPLLSKDAVGEKLIQSVATLFTRISREK
jgi:phosphopantothenoylcysteine decarboxylase / phosphopantothenate---cysteine ligase